MINLCDNGCGRNNVATIRNLYQAQFAVRVFDYDYARALLPVYLDNEAPALYLPSAKLLYEGVLLFFRERVSKTRLHTNLVGEIELQFDWMVEVGVIEPKLLGVVLVHRHREIHGIHTHAQVYRGAIAAALVTVRTVFALAIGLVRERRIIAERHHGHNQGQRKS